MIEFRGYQDECNDAMWAWFEKSAGNPLIVLPTGSGKSMVAARFNMEAVQKFPRTRILNVTHVKELIEQNHGALRALWPDAPTGIYSAGIGRKQTHQQIMFAGVQSIIRALDRFNPFDLCVVDEAHLIPSNPDTMYGKLLGRLLEMNPAMKTIGLTATPYRLDSGSLLDGGIFDGIAYNLPITRLISEGYLSRLRSKSPGVHIDMTGAKTRMGDYVVSEMEERAGLVTADAVRELVTLGANRKAWIIFCISVKHATDVRDCIRAHGVSAEIVTGKTPGPVRASLLARYKRGEIRALCNVNCLTTGFDAPETDLIGFMRPTKSAGLYIQMAGRGMRIAPYKADALVLDWAGVVAEHGPIDTIPLIPEKKKKNDPPQSKECPDCREIVAPGTKECPACGYEWPIAERAEPDEKINNRSYTDAIMSEDMKTQWHPVRAMSCKRHTKPGKPPSLRVSYLVGMDEISEWVCLEHTGFPRTQAERWWFKSATGPCPASVDDALARSDEIRKPTRCTLTRRDGYKKIERLDYEPIEPEQMTLEDLIE